MAAQKQDQNQKQNSQEPEEKQKKKQKQEQKDKKPKKRLPVILKTAICLVLSAAILAFVPYVVEFVNIKVAEGANAKSASSKIITSTASKPTSSTVSKVASSNSSTTSSQKPTQATQTATKKSVTVPLTSMKPVLQAPEFTSGCEVSALTAVLNYYGEPMDKVTISVLFLPTDNSSTVKNGKTYRANPWKVFVGSPESSGYGCFAPVIVETANQYLKAVGSDKRATDLTGAQPSKLYEYISNNIPVIVWATQNMEKSSTTATWYDKDTNKLFEWPGSEHCMVLLADNDTTVTVCDPAKGIVNYDRKTFEERYKELQQQAVVIQ